MNTEKKQWINPQATEMEVNGGPINYQTENSFAGGEQGASGTPAGS